MSTLALRPGAAAQPREWPTFLSELMSQLIKAREQQARRHIAAYLAACDDERLRTLGFSGDDIAAVRAGQFRLPRS